MIKHIAFIVVYFLFADIFPPQLLLSIFIVHSLITIYFHFRKTGLIVDMSNVLVANLIISAVANLNIVNVAGTAQNTTYDYIVLQYIPDAVLIFIVSSSLIYIGMELASNWALPDISINLKKSYEIKLFYIMVLSVIFLDRGFLNRIGLSSLGSLSKFTELLGLFGILYFVRLWKSEQDLKYRRYAIILLLLSTYVSIQT
jgi:hypothetical protein